MARSESQRDPPSPSQPELVCSSLSEEFTDSSRAESQPATESAPLLQSTLLLSWSTSQLRSSSWPETPQRTSKSEESPPDTCSSPSEETKNSISSSRPPLLVEVLSPTFTRTSSSDRLARAKPNDCGSISLQIYLI